jgi:vacuolar-type H+-ATPase subunit F/Vma7
MSGAILGSAIFIGDELTAAGFRLTGIETLVPAPADARTVFAGACARTDCVVITAGLAQHIPMADLEAALLAEKPIVAVISDIRSQTLPPDLTRRLRDTLGIEI